MNPFGWLLCYFGYHDPNWPRINRTLRYRCERCKAVVFVE